MQYGVGKPPLLNCHIPPSPIQESIAGSLDLGVHIGSGNFVESKNDQIVLRSDRGVVFDAEGSQCLQFNSSE
jgi:hypothetical protein